MNYLKIDGILLKKYDDTYYIGQHGEVYSTYSHKFLKPEKNNIGYLRVNLHGKHKLIHKLVYETWIGSIPKGLQINHKNDNKLDNYYKNLYSGTQKENIEDCINNQHRRGHTYCLIVYDNKIQQAKTFYPAKDFIEYCGHPSKNGSIKKFFNKNWFKQRFTILHYSIIHNEQELKDVTTMADECKPVG